MKKVSVKRSDAGCKKPSPDGILQKKQSAIDDINNFGTNGRTNHHMGTSCTASESKNAACD